MIINIEGSNIEFIHAGSPVKGTILYQDSFYYRVQEADGTIHKVKKEFIDNENKTSTQQKLL